MTAGDLFNRAARLQVGTLDVSNLRFGFEIEKHLRKEPNTAKVSVWNLNESQRKELEERDSIPVQLEAGYANNRPLLFSGILDTAFSEREDADWITNVFSHDGKKAITARERVSYRAGTSVQKIATDLAEALDVGLGNLRQVLAASGGNIDGVGPTLAHGFASRSGTADSLFRVLRDAGVEASIQDGEIQATKRGQALAGGSVLLRRDSGLIGNPAVDRKGRLGCTCLIVPGLNPGLAIQVESVTANGVWRVDSVTYVGDTFGGEWYAHIEGAPLV